METRLLKYFLVTAHTGNITKAANLLHITQPTLSRQLQDLENQLQTALFVRQKSGIVLTPAGLIFQKRANAMLAFLEETKNELSSLKQQPTATLRLGIVESSISYLVTDLIAQFQKRYPLVKFSLYDADGDDLKEKLDNNQLDLIFLIRPIEAEKYHFFSLPATEQWGVYLAKNDPLATKKQLQPQDLKNHRVLLPRRKIVQDELDLILKEADLNIAGYINLGANGILLVKKHHYALVSIASLQKLINPSQLTFVTFEPKLTSGHVVAWSKQKEPSQILQRFLKFINDNIKNNDQTYTQRLTNAHK